jgi:protein-S-isoprenylcysteine O-methyltransferase Ste14
MLDSVFKLIYVIGLVTGSVIRAVHIRRYKQNRIADDYKTALDRLLVSFSSLGLIIIPLFYLLSPWLDFADYHLPVWPSLIAGVAGAVVFAIALWLLWRSHADLGRNWSPHLEISEGQSLVTQGVFRYMRHPMYAAHCLWGIAQALLLQNWIAGLSMLVSSLPLYLVRIPREEQMMLEHFGEEYHEYMNHTGRVIPRLRRTRY